MSDEAKPSSGTRDAVETGEAEALAQQEEGATSAKLTPVLAIVGRPNVGKSTLFNALTRTRSAVVADYPGLTRDRQYGVAHFDRGAVIVVDTGGLVSDAHGLTERAADQAARAVDAADLSILVCDAGTGLTAEDHWVAERLRRTGRPVLVAVNKVDGSDPALAESEFFELGFGTPVAIAALPRRGLRRLVTEAEAILAARLEPARKSDNRTGTGTGTGIDTGIDTGTVPRARPSAHPLLEAPGVRVAVVGRPNAGKSSLINRLLGEDRVLTDSVPGTTRDSVFIPFTHRGRRYTLIDTAGVRRRARVNDRIEKFSVLRTLQAIELADVVVLLLDATAEIAEQDLRLLGHVVDAGRALVIGLNKWDAADAEARRRIRSECDRRLRFLDYAHIDPVSAVTGRGLAQLMARARAASEAARAELSTPDLTRALEAATNRHPLPMVKGTRVKLRYAHQGGTNPPRIVLHGTRVASIPPSYLRYLASSFREAFGLHGTPIKLELRQGKNPYEGRKNPLTARQVKRRQRLVRHAKRRS